MKAYSLGGNQMAIPFDLPSRCFTFFQTSAYCRIRCCFGSISDIWGLRVIQPHFPPESHWCCFEGSYWYLGRYKVYYFLYIGLISAFLWTSYNFESHSKMMILSYTTQNLRHNERYKKKYHFCSSPGAIYLISKINLIFWKIPICYSSAESVTSFFVFKLLNSMFRSIFHHGKSWLSGTHDILCFWRFIGHQNSYKSGWACSKNLLFNFRMYIDGF